MRNRVALAIELLKRHGKVSMGLIAQEHPEAVYTARNAFSEAKPILAQEGFIIEHHFGKTWRENTYELKRFTGELF